MVKAFDKKYADQRKEWLSLGVEHKEYEEEKGVERVPVSEFINHEFIDFSLEDCQRSLPNVMDGLKESQRKVLYACFKKRLNTHTKVAQLAGSVAEITQYHHGEQNLLDTIIKLAQNFVGSNNIPYLTREGQFGSRLEGGADAAAARYIYTSLEKHTRLIFREEDDPLLTYVQSDGDSVEPEYYYPILPMLLVNGCSGIGTGWSSSVPAYNPTDIIAWIRLWIEEESESKSIIEADHDELVPWYRGFTGKIELERTRGVATRAVTHGTFTPGKKVEISELPIGVWTNSYTERVEEWLESKAIAARELHSTVDRPRFLITPGEEFEVSEKNLKLTSYLPMTNMVAFDKEKKIRKYATTEDIMREFCEARYKMYKKRKEYQIGVLEGKLQIENNRVRFLKEVMSGELELFRKSEEWVESELVKRKYQKKEESYEYLIGMPIRSFTQQKIDALEKSVRELEKELAELRQKKPGQIWMEELAELERAL
jgi:DNA topoisomerase-2